MLSNEVTQIYGVDSDGTIANIILRDLKKLGLEDIMQSGNTVLDIGCGFGYLLRRMNKRFPGFDLYGVDLLEKCISKAKENVPSAKIIQANFQSLPFKNESFNMIVSSNIVDYSFDGLFDKTFDIKNLVKEIYRVLKIGGVYATFDHYGLDETSSPWLGTLSYFFERKGKLFFVKNKTESQYYTEECELPKAA